MTREIRYEAPVSLRKQMIEKGLCVGPTYENDYDACPCDEPDCLVCVERKEKVAQRETRRG